MKRLSRLVVRFVGWCIAAFAFVLAVVLLVSAAYLVFFDYPEHIRVWMESEASRVLGRPVRIESFSVNLPNSFELVGVSADPRGSGPPWLECKKLNGQLNLSGVFSSRLQLSMLQVDGLVLRIQDYGGGKVDLPGLWRPEAPERRPRTAAPLSIEAERIVVNDAQFLYQNHNLPWRLEAYQVEAAVERAQGGSYQGRLAYDRGELKIKDRPAFEGGISAQLELLSNELRLKELRAAGPFYEIRAQGAVDFNDQPEGQFVIDVESQVGPAARSLLGWPQLDDGGPLPARIHGNLSVGRGWHLFEGDLDVPMAKFLGASLRDWKGKIYWNRTVLELTEAEGRLANGDSELLLRQPLPVAEHAAQLSMEFQGVSLRALTESVTGEPGYLDSLLSGEVRLSMPPSQPLQASGDFELAGRSPGETTAGQYGLELNAQGVLDEGTVTLGASRFDTGSTTASLSGRYPWSGAADLSVELSSGDLREADRLQQILRGLFHPGETIPLLNLEGSGDVGGTLTGRIPALTFQGRFRGANVRFKEVEFSQVDAQGMIDATHLRLADLHAQWGASEVHAQVELDLTKPASEWKFDGTLHEWPVSDIDQLMPLPLDVTGALSADGSVVSEGGQYTGQGTFTLKAGSIYGLEFDEVRAETELRGQQTEFKSITISRRNAKVSGQLFLDSGAGRLDGSFEGRELPLSVFRREGFELRGVARGELRLTGTLDEPMLEMTLSAPEVSLGQTSLGRGLLQAQVDRGVATGKLTFQDPAFEIEAQSQVRLVPGSPFEGEIRWQGADLGPWVRFFQSGLPPSVRFFSNGEASLKGEWSSLQSTEVDASVESIRAEIGGYRLVSEESVEVRVRNGVVETPGIHLSGEGTQVEIAGKLPLGEGDLDLQANGSVNLEMLQSFYPRVSSSGDVQLSARVTGDWNRPYLSGQADVSSGVLRFRGFPQAMGDIRGRIAFDNRTVRFPNIRATFGGAPVGILGNDITERLEPIVF